jgi:hypothetical protein
MQDPNPPNPDLMRLDNMLIAEEIVEGNSPQNRIQDQTTIENAEYKNKLGQIQRIYKQEIEKINQGMEEHFSFFDITTYSKAPIIHTIFLKFLAAHSMYCRNGISTSMYDRNFK